MITCQFPPAAAALAGSLEHTAFDLGSGLLAGSTGTGPDAVTRIGQIRIAWIRLEGAHAASWRPCRKASRCSAQCGPDKFTATLAEMCRSGGTAGSLGADRLAGLIRLAEEHKRSGIRRLGPRRLGHVEVSDDGDSVRVSPRGWIDRKEWREINDILRLDGFGWITNGKDSCWMKMGQ